MQDELGLSPATLDWELLAQSADGAVEMLGVGDDLASTTSPSGSPRSGWAEPEDEDGVWVGGPDVLVGVGSGLTPELQHFVLLPDRGLVLASDQAPYLEQVMEVVDGDADAAEASPTWPQGSAIRSRQRCTTATTRASASRWPRPTTTPAPRRTSWWPPPVGSTRSPASRWACSPAGTSGRCCRWRTPTTHRATPTRAPSWRPARLPGRAATSRTGSPSRTPAREGREITLDLRPAEGAYVLSDLTSGPVLFATC